MSKHWWKDSAYIFHDSIGKYWNYYFRCGIVGHGRVRDVSWSGETAKWYCFDCETTISATRYDCGVRRRH